MDSIFDLMLAYPELTSLKGQSHEKVCEIEPEDARIGLN
jgi:hypothetical protein